MNNALTRVLTAAIGIPLVVLVAYAGGTVFAGVIAVAAIVAQLELYDLQRRIGWNPSSLLGVILALVVLVRYEIGWNDALLILVVLAVVADLLRTGPNANPAARLGGTLLGVLYPVWLFSYLVDIRVGLESTQTRMDAFGATMMLLVLIWAADSAAYYVGKAVGKRPLAPSISPKKTWEGSLASFPGALIAGILFKILWLSFFSWIDIVVLAVIAGAWGQVGDLAESVLKRNAGVKDSGSVLPGHGGMLDRIDSLVVSVPVYYIYLKYLSGLL